MSNGLRFNETLSWRIGKPIPVQELTKRLQELASELRDAEQERVPREALSKPAHELSSSNILNHKDRGIRAFALCCIVDVLRLCAPEAPFTDSQLRDIFLLIITSVIPALSDSSNPYNAQHCYVLHSLAQVKSAVLLTDVSDSNELIGRLMTGCFDVLSTSGNELSKNVEYNMTTMIQCIVEECHSVPANAADMIFAQFLRADPSLRLGVASNSSGGSGADIRNIAREPPASYNMAKNICNTCVDRMARCASQYFSNVIVDSSIGDSSYGTDDIDAASTSLNPDDANQLRKAHRLLRELWRASPLVLQNVIPQIETELQASNEELRLIATEAVGDLIAGIGASGPLQPPKLDLTIWPTSEGLASTHEPVSSAPPLSFVQLHPSTYRSFVSRRNDKSPTIRATWTACIGRIASSSSTMPVVPPAEMQELVDLLSTMLVDADERVRVAAVRAIAAMPVKHVAQRLGVRGGLSHAGSVLYHLVERAKDKRVAVRAEALPLLGRLWAFTISDEVTDNLDAQDMFSDMPSKLFDAYYTNDMDTHALIDDVLFECLVPIGFPLLKSKSVIRSGSSEEQGGSLDSASDKGADAIRIRRMLQLRHALDPKARAVLELLYSRPARLMKFMAALMQRFEDYNGGIMDTNEVEIRSHLKRLVDVFAKTFPDSEKAATDLMKFAKLHDRRCYSLIRFCISTESDYRKIQKALRELRKRLDASSLATGSAADTIYHLVRKCSHLFYNKSHITPLLAISQNATSSLASDANEVLKDISSISPAVLKNHAEEICEALALQASNSQLPVSMETLKACSAFARRIPEAIPKDRKFIHAMLALATKQTAPKSAKYAVSILLHASDKQELHAKTVLKQSVEGFDVNQPEAVCKLAAISQVMLLASQHLEDEDCDAATDVAINKVLQHSSEPIDEIADIEWAEPRDNLCEAKIWALKILVNRVRSARSIMLDEIATPVFTLLNRLIARNGEILKEGRSPRSHCSAMRLQAALSLLKLSARKSSDNLLSPLAFNKLAEMAQDPLFPIRKRFVEKLMRSLSAEQLPTRFYTICFLTAFEPSERLLKECSTWLKARANALTSQGKNTMEGVLARLISTLAYHPDFDSQFSDLIDFSTYILFYLKAVATEDNIHLIYHVAQRVKGVRDGLPEGKHQALYTLSDLTQAIIRHYVEVKDWPLLAYSGKASLPQGVFLPMPTHNEAQSVSETMYLPELFGDTLEAVVKASLRSKKRKAGEDNLAKERVQKAAAGPTKFLRKRDTAGKKSDKKKNTNPRKGDSLREAIIERRRSSRISGTRPSYIESDDSEHEQLSQRFAASENDTASEDSEVKSIRSHSIPASPSQGSEKENSTYDKETTVHIRHGTARNSRPRRARG